MNEAMNSFSIHLVGQIKPPAIFSFKKSSIESSSNEKVITENDAYFKAKEKLYHKNGLNNFMTAVFIVLHSKETILNKKVKIYQKEKKVFLC